MDKVPINFDLMSNPYNWVIVVLMVMLASLCVHYIFSTSVVSV